MNSLSESEIERICQALQPLSKIVLRGDVRNIATAKNLERVGSGSDRFHRIYRGEHIRTRDKIVLHLYDLSAADDPKTEDLARRHAETLQKLQKSAFVPRIMDSYQEVPQYPGELWYFSIVDPCAPAIADRCADGRWEMGSRCEFAKRAVDALAEMHATGLRDVQFVHRHISPSSLLVGANNQPVFTDFDLARISGSMTLSPNVKLGEADAEFAAPEAVKQGLGSADQRSDVYSLCKSLSILFTDLNSDLAVKTLLQLEAGISDDPANRCSLAELSQSLNAPDTQAASGAKTQAMTMAARYWSEGDLVTFNTRQFRIASRIGTGSFGSTFKVIEVHEGQDVGIYAGKVMFDGDSGQRALNAYRRARSHTVKPQLATVHEIANEWEDDRFIALLQWVEGRTLHDWIGYAEMYAEERGETPVFLIGRWITNCCEGLSSLHRAGLVHGDVSPKNIIEHAGDVSLVDFDLLLPQGETSWSGGTILYTPVQHAIGNPANCSHDVYALAATMYHVVFDRQPFWYGGEKRREQGRDWNEIDRSVWQWIPEFLDKATANNVDERFANAMTALKWVKQKAAEAGANFDVPETKVYKARVGDDTTSKPVTAKNLSIVEDDSDVEMRTANRVDWLAELLSTYPGSPHGGKETRGLDSAFAHQTYVETTLEANLLEDIKGRKVQLVILCGNAGDGKTAFLQHLSVKLGLGNQNSSERVATGSAFGLSVKINLDGAASFRGKTADELLNDLFEPFQHGKSEKPRIHLVAVNDGRLLQWAEDYESNNSETPLTDWIIETLIGDELPSDPMDHIRLINLNERSLVGDARQLPKTEETKATWKPSTEFFNSLLYRMLGGDRTEAHWAPCRSCSAASRCTAWNSVQALTGKSAGGNEVAANIREQLAEALQAVHQQGQVHVTTRELRGALSYIFLECITATTCTSSQSLSQNTTGIVRLVPIRPCGKGNY